VLLILLAYLGGALTIVSPCVLPVLPFVFARTGQPFARSLLPMLLGLAVTFAAVATLAAVGGGWAVRANTYGRVAALVLLAVFGVMLLWPALAERLTRPLVSFGAHLSQSPGTGVASTVGTSLLLGVATGFLWAPCAGPILGLLLTGAAIQGASAETSLLLFAYAAGAATSLALALLIGGRVFAALKRSLGVSEWLRRALGVAVLAGVVLIASGLDTGLLTRLSIARTTSIEQSLLDRFHATHAAKPESQHALADEGALPPLVGANAWLNSPALSAEGLRGKVVLVDFWTYSCINCLRSLPYVAAWNQKYREHGLVIIGVHAPEFAFEKNIGNVIRAVRDLHITYPVAIDNDYAIWRGFNNEFWPAHYLIDAQGRIRDHHFGEGDYGATEDAIRQLLTQAGQHNLPGGYVSVQADGVAAAADSNDVQSPETYIGFERARDFASPGGELPDQARDYALPSSLDTNQWALGGSWFVGGELATLKQSPGRIVFRFHARDLHLVLGPSTNGKPIRYRVQLDGTDPGANHGADTDAQGLGVVNEHRLFQLIRQSGDIRDRTFTIEFLDAGVQAYSFTFG
jgi:cytochrome c biogenesis protein CcdA/thiol-disulfide isomerase/thioredoxin